MSQLSPLLMFGIIAGYFLILFLISYITGKKADQKDFFLANKQSPWYLVAFGMIGATLSGVTFISIPGAVGAFPDLYENVTGTKQLKPNIGFSYMQMVFGYFLGYIVIAQLLLPLYYKMNLTSIYTYIEKRLGSNAHWAAAGFFMISRTIGASFRLYLVAIVFQTICNITGVQVPFWLTVAITILLIWLYTSRGGIKTIVYTDTLQTLFMITAVVFTIISIGNSMGKNLGEVVSLVSESQYSKMFFFENGWSDPNNFFKQFFAGALITIVMTGLDQDMMQKNLSCRNLREAKINMLSFGTILIFVNVLFLGLGALLYLYSNSIGLEIPTQMVKGELTLKTDLLYPFIALQHLSPVAGIAFILGIIAAAYSSADSALTSLTTSFCVDFLGFEKKENQENNRRTRLFVHLGFSVLLFLVILVFNAWNDDSVITKLFILSGYTYGPLLGLFAFGMFTNLEIKDKLAIPICVATPFIAYFLNQALIAIGFNLGFLIILLNGLIAFTGLVLISQKRD